MASALGAIFFTILQRLPGPLPTQPESSLLQVERGRDYNGSSEVLANGVSQSQMGNLG